MQMLKRKIVYFYTYMPFYFLLNIEFLLKK